MLREFFAVTTSGSLYEVSTEKSDRDYPTIKRLAGRHNSTMQCGSCLQGGSLVGISDTGICLFYPTEHQGRAFENAGIATRGGKTQGIVGLFFKLEDAQKCLESGELTALHSRYMGETTLTLMAIGDDHPVFVIGASMKFITESM